MSQPTDMIEVIPAQLDSQRYHITRQKAEILAARGLIVMIPGLKRAKEVSTRPRGTLREWRKVSSYDPELRFGIPTMQLVPPRISRRRPASTSTNHASNGKRKHSTPTTLN